MLQAPLFTAYALCNRSVLKLAAVYDLREDPGGQRAVSHRAALIRGAPSSGMRASYRFPPGKVPSWFRILPRNIFNIGAGNWSSAASDYWELASGGASSGCRKPRRLGGRLGLSAGAAGGEGGGGDRLPSAGADADDARLLTPLAYRP